MVDTLRYMLDAEWTQAIQQPWDRTKDPSRSTMDDENVYWCFQYGDYVTPRRGKISHHGLDRLRQWLLDAMDGSPDALWERQLDDAMSSSFILELPPSLDSNKEMFLSRALSLLGRVGQRPHHMDWSNAFGEEEDPGLGASISPGAPSTLVLRIALAVAASENGRLSVVLCLRDLIIILSKLIDTGLEDGACLFNDADDSLRDFVFGTWCQVLKLYLWYIVAHYITAGYDAEWDRFLVLKDNVKMDRRSRLYSRSNIHLPRYMCNWAFRMLRHNRVSFALDFRQLFRRFRDFHGDKKARCYGHDPWNSCTGLHPLSCGRFQDISLVLPEQSVHTDVCNHRQCHRMKWDRKSYDELDGCARAVRIRAADEKKTRITYVGGSERTMAISHVWSHGHGGRPATGMNRCLHDRFSDIARRAGCDSYWIDTLSIPEDHTRRTEAIHHINDTFFQARMVLIVDRDIMSMDITNGHGEDGRMTPYTPSTIPIRLLESIIATFLVCDWNVRAWTMLEAVKGCRNLHLLCQHGHTLSLQGCLHRLLDEGSIDMATTLLAAQHLLPVARDARQPPSRGLDAAGATLNYRHATREGDEMVIWSLMTNMRPQTNAVDFWKAMVGRRIRTGFLVSTIRRLRGVAGFSWAPVTPYMRWWEGFERRTHYEYWWERPIMPSDGSGSRLAEITERGLRGEWLFYRVRPVEDYELAYNVPNADLGCPCLRVAACLTSWAHHVAVIDAVAEDGAERYEGRPTGDGISTQNSAFPIIWSEDGETWEWYGVYAWRPADNPLVMEVKELVIV